MPGLKNLTYEARLEALKLPSLVYRRIRGDMINVFKYIKGIYRVDHNHILPLETDTKTRGHSFKLMKSRCRTVQRQNFFSQRVVDWWNALPEEVVQAPSVNSFKNRIDKYFKNHPVFYNYRALDKPSLPAMTIATNKATTESSCLQDLLS